MIMMPSRISMRFLLSQIVVMVIGDSPSIIEGAKGPDSAQALTNTGRQSGQIAHVLKLITIQLRKALPRSEYSVPHITASS